MGRSSRPPRTTGRLPHSAVAHIVVMMASGATDPTGQQAPQGKPNNADTPAGAPSKSDTPNLTVPQILAFVAFLVFVGFAFGADATNTNAVVRPDELDEVRKFAIFLIGALLPSDAVIRFGRNLLFQTMDNAEDAAASAPATTLAQLLAFGAFVVVALLTLISNKLVSVAEFAQVNEVARTLVVALLPSEAVIRFARALYYRSPNTPAPNAVALKRV